MSREFENQNQMSMLIAIPTEKYKVAKKLDRQIYEDAREIFPK